MKTLAIKTFKLWCFGAGTVGLLAIASGGDVQFNFRKPVTK